MHHFGTFFLWALVACILCHGSLAKDLRSGQIFLLQDLGSNMCDNIVEAQNQGNPRDADIDVKAKLDRLEVKMGEMRAKQEEQLQELEAKMEEQRAVLTKVETKLEEILLAVQPRLDNKHQADLKKTENNLQAVSNKTDAAKVKIVPPGFERIGTRYFRIVKKSANWDTANRRCREMGGYLASFRNEEEINAISRKLDYMWTWLGINDRDAEGHFVSVASGKPAEFFNRRRVHTNFHYNCLAVNSDEMRVDDCTLSFHYICQADNET